MLAICSSGISNWGICTLNVLASAVGASVMCVCWCTDGRFVCAVVSMNLDRGPSLPKVYYYLPL